MAKEIAIGKRAKISQAQQYMLLAVFGAAVFLGIAIALVLHFIKTISFNTRIIMAEEESIATYSKVIETTGVCKKPSGSIYSDSELEKCNPDAIETSEIPGTLRYEILENLAANEALNSVPKETNSNCINPETGKSFTFQELTKASKEAKGANELHAASQLIKSCSALRIIPDAIPAYENEEALLASLNNIFNISGWSPESISPGNASDASSSIDGLENIAVNLIVEADSGVTMNVLNNIERSIREFNIERATIEWSGNASLSLRAQATAYHTNKSTISETTKTISPEEGN
ncbi:hypothetical protein J6S37_03175 [Candidatus Saccharibacteria bacterium]|nr:hypothetical protein [Candidatus Saccharibacteria bacterium]